MIIPALQFLSCLSLLTVALLITAGWGKAPKLLFPAILAASIAGIALVGPYLVEIFVISYSGAIYEMEAITYRLNGPYRWFYFASAILPLLPILALVPPVRKLPVLVAILALLAAVPAAFWTFQELAFG